MKFLITSLKKFYLDDFCWRSLLVSIILSGLLISVNELFFIESKLTAAFQYKPLMYLIELLQNCLAYFGSFFVLRSLKLIKVNEIKKYLLVSFIGIAIFSFYSTFYEYIYLIRQAPMACRIWLHYVTENLSGIISLCIPLYLVWRFLQKKDVDSFYGFHLKNIVWLRYIDVLFFIVIAMFFAMKIPGVSDYYPILDNVYFRVCANYLEVPKWITAVVFEISYMSDFIWVELFFRGFLVIGLIRYLGKDAILPMVVLYVLIHFGKPTAEVISSFFGGYLLGIVAYQTRNIRAGIVLHITLALSAEAFGVLINSQF